MSHSLNSVVSELKSEKVKERQQGIANLRHAFSRDSAVANLDEKGDGRAWLVLFQALFTAVLHEKEACTKKSTSKSANPAAAAIRRLSEASAAVRWLVERSVALMNKKVVKALLTHLLQVLVYKGSLYSPVALDYIKALKCIASHGPHLDHLNDESWVQIVELAFNVVLNDPVIRSIEDEGDENGASNPVDGSDLGGSDPDEDEEDEDEDELMTPAKKRRRGRQGSAIPSSSSRKLSPQKRLRHATRTVTLEQIELTSLLAILLQSSSAPLLSSGLPKLSSAILTRLGRFLDLYPSDTSLHHDYLQALLATLTQLSLNKKSDVERFARRAWDGLVRLWGTKNKSMKEGLVAVLKTLFPFIVADSQNPESTGFDYADGLWRLWTLLEGEADSRWGIDGLTMESLRLTVILEDEVASRVRAPFTASTFRAGLRFDAGQALAWVILELQADCTKTLFQLSESTTSRPGRSEAKRTRLENPIAAVLQSIQTHTQSSSRAYHLQRLLFIVDRHWSSLHQSLQEDILSALVPFISVEDASTQSWAFLCLGAVIYADRNAHQQHSPSPSQDVSLGSGDTQRWDTIWTHAIRRTVVPAVCRAACHAGYILLAHAKELLTSHRVLAEIETLAKDLDVQGPSFPYDSICAFLAHCLRVASQDVRLYRMQLEEKVLSWLIDSWRFEGVHSFAGSGARLTTHMVSDVLLLVETICGFSKRSNVLTRVLLPDCAIAKVVEGQAETKVILDFILYATLPPFRPPNTISNFERKIHNSASESAAPALINSTALAEPRGKERRLSAFLLKSLDSVISDWESFKEQVAHPTAEMARGSLDLAVVALVYEALLVANGTRLTRRVVQAACKLMLLIVPLLLDSKWNTKERAQVLLGLDPLVNLGDDHELGWESMLPPNVGTGIKTETLQKLRSELVDSKTQRRASRCNFLRIIMQSADVQDTFTRILANVRDIIRLLVGQKVSDPDSNRAMDVDERDGFGVIRTEITSTDATRRWVDDRSQSCLVEVSLSLLTVAPALQSTSGEPTRDKELIDLVLDCHDNLLVASAFFDRVLQGTLILSLNNLDRFLLAYSEMLGSYTYSRSEAMQLLIINTLNATTESWRQPGALDGEVGEHIRELCLWLSDIVKGGKIASWKVRDTVACFFDRYLSIDSAQAVWRQDMDEVDVDNLPSSLLPKLGQDQDIRVRFRAAVANAHLFDTVLAGNEDPLVMYHNIKTWLTSELAEYEHMLTRMLSLGNIMVISSAVRRGPYWHLLEACLHSSVYSQHIEVVLKGVAERMGLQSFSVLFQAYASQIAYSIRQAKLDFLRFPPHLLGYRDRKECAEASFRSFTPTNILAGGPNQEAIVHGQKLFLNHCKAMQRTPTEGLQMCFGDIIGFQVVSWVDAYYEDVEGTSEELYLLIKEKTSLAIGADAFDVCLQKHVDSIVVAILCTLGEQDFSDGGGIMACFQEVEGLSECGRSFQALNKYRHLFHFRHHTPNLPSYSAKTVYSALEWFGKRLPDLDTKATSYHVLHELFAIIQRSPLVNEQMRLINALIFWMAYQYERFGDFTLLHTVVQGAASLLSQVDLARAAQSILEWAFSIYPKVDRKDPRFPDILIRICGVAHQYTRSAHPLTAELGRDLLRWIDDQALALSRFKQFRQQVVAALPAWPHQPSSDLIKVFEDISSDDLSKILADPRISSNKFRLVRQLRAFGRDSAYSNDQFVKHDFWRLKECIPSSLELEDEDIDAFTSLLVSTKGHIYSYGSEQYDSQSVRTRHRHGPQKKRSTSVQVNAVPQHAIVLSLLAMLDTGTWRQVYVAYATLRSLMSASASDTLQMPSWPAEYRVEISFLKEHPRDPAARKPRNISELKPDTLPDTAREFLPWISTIATLFSDILGTDPFFAQLQTILDSDAAFSEDVLPVLVHTLLNSETEKLEEDGSYRATLSVYFTALLRTNEVNAACRKTVVDIVLHLRNFRRPDSTDALAQDRWLDIDFTLLAQNAIMCGAYTTALLFLELAVDYRGDGELDQVTIEQIMFDIYSHIDEPDGFYGIKTKDLNQFLIKRFHHEKQWEKAFRFHGAALEAGRVDPSDRDGLVQSFHSFGFDRLAMDAVQDSSNPNATHTPSTMSYSLGWRTETWDLPDQPDVRSNGVSLYLAIRAVHRERDAQTINSIVRRSLSDEMTRLRVLGPENLAEIREVTQNLMCLAQITRWRSPTVQSQFQRREMDLQSWSDFTTVHSEFEFSDLESLVATRVSLIRSVRQKEQRDQLGSLSTPFVHHLYELEKKCLVHLSEAARASNQIQIALNSIVRSQKLEKKASVEVSAEFSSVLWLQQEQKLAVEFLREIIESPEGKSIPKPQRSLLLANLGTWTAEACLEKGRDILHHYFDIAISLISDMEPSCWASTNYATVYQQCAIFSEHRYKDILRDPDVRRWKTYLERKTQEIKSWRDQISKTAEKTPERHRLEKELEKANKLFMGDRQSSRQYDEDRDRFLRQAIDMYSKTLQTSDTSDDDSVIRLCSLWFANFDDLALQEKVKVALDRVPSRKFVFLAHQLSARMSKSPTSQLPANQRNLQSLIVRMCKEHPFHSLYQVYCLRPEHDNRRHSGRLDTTTSQSERAAAATDIFDRLRGNPGTTDRVHAVEKVCDACKHWALYPINNGRYKDSGVSYSMPDDARLHKLGKITVPVVTEHTPIDPTLRYDHCVWINHYDAKFSTAGGVNLPKINVCHGNDGREYKQLFKGNDDLRQDAVMEQVFELVNSVLHLDRETKRRELHIRNYKVIPLASQAGVLEFVTNTQPLKSWLFPAHTQYRPQDVSVKEFFKMGALQKAGQVSNDVLVKMYKDLTAKFKPVMRHYFTERHKTPIAWFAMRLNYTRSVATTSIVGHVLGLGDRHTSNILMDNGTGEVVHIDLGIAFDQGKLLPVPERVPFRMTRDMVDGMGISRTQGVFQRCAEETLRVLRTKSEVIMTVLEVFKYDPLHSWTASELKVKRVQGTHTVESTTAGGDASRTGFGAGRGGLDMSSGTAEEAADRALSSVERKLDKKLSVEYTVNELLAEATDITNLALIFGGWQPYY